MKISQFLQNFPQPDCQSTAMFPPHHQSQSFYFYQGAREILHIINTLYAIAEFLLISCSVHCMRARLKLQLFTIEILQLSTRKILQLATRKILQLATSRVILHLSTPSYGCQSTAMVLPNQPVGSLAHFL